MSKAPITVPEVDIPSLRKKQTQRIDLMKPGGGTPWEDRGSHGLIGAFVRTCFGMMFRPVANLWSIRRPETRSDASAFALVCGMLWGVSWIIHSLLIQWRSGELAQEALLTLILVAIFQLVIASVAVFLFLRFTRTLVVTLVAGGDARQQAPATLIHNVYAYCLGPSLLAPIPILGPLAAGAWIVVLLIVAAIHRLEVKFSGAIVCTLLAVGAAAGIGAGVYFAARVAWWVATF